LSYLTLPSIHTTNASKGTISFWFRFSQDSVDKARRYGNDYSGNDDGINRPTIFDGVIPLVTFGVKQQTNIYEFEYRLDGTFNPPPPYNDTDLYRYKAYSFHPVDAGTAPFEPSHIGIDCMMKDENGEDGPPTLKLYFQMDTKADMAGLYAERIEVHWQSPPSAPGQPPFQQYQTVLDRSDTVAFQPESFLINPKFPVTPDQWHHILVSFDFSGGVAVRAIERAPTEHVPGDGISSWCSLWYAFDDEDKNGEDGMGNAWASNKGPNAIVTQNANNGVFDSSSFSYTDEFTTGAQWPEYSWPSSPLPINGGPMGFPASADYVETVYHCELAEFQMWFGVTLDTGIEAKRRAFVDMDGKPVPPDKTASATDHASGSIALLGKPDILLHGSSNWIAGKNTGSRGVDADGNVIPGGQFAPTGGIEKYTPDPSLAHARL
jgi:hypothetical protein